LRMLERGMEGNAVDIEKALARVDGVPEERILRAIVDNFPSTVTEFEKVRAGVIRARIDRRELHRACRFLRDSLGFEHLSMISAVEHEDRFGIVYHIWSYQHKVLVELLTSAPKEDPTVDSVSSVWGGANWHERETYDLMGVRFNNHPRLERILLPRDYLYHPLRKDFKG